MPNPDSERYAAAVVWFLDRDTGAEKAAYLYPVTKVTLKQRDNPEHEDGTLVVGEDGTWRQVPDRATERCSPDGHQT